MKGVALINPFTKSNSAVSIKVCLNHAVSVGTRISAGPVRERFFCQINYAASLYMYISDGCLKAVLLVICGNSIKDFVSICFWQRCLVILADPAAWAFLSNTDQLWIGSLAKKKSKHFSLVSDISALLQVLKCLYEMSFSASSLALN